MALFVDQHQSNFKYFCKICKKGFLCGRALGGHMRAHGIGDEIGHIDDDDEDHASEWEGDVPPGNNKSMYALRTNPNRLKSCRVCENCGKELLSWKSFLEHGKCSSEDAGSLVSSPVGSDDEDGVAARKGCGWSKRKRSLRAASKVGNFLNLNSPSSEEEDLANCLIMLSNASADHLVVAEPEESCASASKEEVRRNTLNLIPPIAYEVPNVDKAKGVAKGLFECKACKKVFNSHQALGGHRASHKKVKGCYAARLNQDQGLDDNLADEDVTTHEEFFPTKSSSTLQFDHGTIAPLVPTSKRKSKVHECSICCRVFSSGQALGGHKRCHWITSNSPDTSSPAKFHHYQFQDRQRPNNFINNSESSLDLKLDLNLPAPGDDLAGVWRDPVNPSSFEVPTEIYLQSWIGIDSKEEDHNHHQQHPNDNDNNNNNNNNNSCNGSVQNIMDDEADSKVKLAKLSGLKYMKLSGGSSPWLQVGIGSTTEVRADL